MNSRVAGLVGVLLALWMSAGRWLFGIGGPLTWWYLPTIGLVYAAASIWLARRVRIAGDRGRRTGTGTRVALLASWASAIGFGLSVPDDVDGELVSILSSWFGSTLSAEMSIAICNPLGIMALTFLGIALVFAHLDVRDPRPEPTDEELAGPPVHPGRPG